MQKRKMTQEEFDGIKDRFASLSMNAVTLAQLVWVEEMPQSAAAEKLGMSRQSAYALLKRANAHLNGLPGDWVKVEEWMPEELAKEVRARLKVERAKHGLPKPV